MRLVMLGLPGAGKGTQGELLAQRLGIPRISTGDMFREALRSETALGRQVKEYVERGELVPDHLTVALVEERLKQPDARAGFVLDGFPRTVPQARALDEKLAAAGRPLHAAVYINVPQEEAIRRIASRRVCGQCGATYSAGQGAADDGRCPACGGPLVQRPDDSEETARHRLQVYMAQTHPVVEYYRQEGLLVEVDGQQSIPDVLNDILQALAAVGSRRQDVGAGGGR
ncbi:MAG: adenylate kinase [Limnochordales bacterium]|nr:adenylate kinase [Limnochordales bacterium]